MSEAFRTTVPVMMIMFLTEEQLETLKGGSPLVNGKAKTPKGKAAKGKAAPPAVQESGSSEDSDDSAEPPKKKIAAATPVVPKVRCMVTVVNYR